MKIKNTNELVPKRWYEKDGSYCKFICKTASGTIVYQNKHDQKQRTLSEVDEGSHLVGSDKWWIGSHEVSERKVFRK